MITVFTVDAALQHVSGIFRERADKGDITPAERDLLMDGAILLAMHIDELSQDGRADSWPPWPEGSPAEHAGRHERHAVAPAA